MYVLPPVDKTEVVPDDAAAAGVGGGHVCIDRLFMGTRAPSGSELTKR